MLGFLVSVLGTGLVFVLIGESVSDSKKKEVASFGSQVSLAGSLMAGTAGIGMILFFWWKGLWGKEFFLSPSARVAWSIIVGLISLCFFVRTHQVYSSLRSLSKPEEKKKEKRSLLPSLGEIFWDTLRRILPRFLIDFPVVILCAIVAVKVWHSPLHLSFKILLLVFLSAGWLLFQRRVAEPLLRKIERKIE